MRITEYGLVMSQGGYAKFCGEGVYRPQGVVAHSCGGLSKKFNAMLADVQLDEKYVSDYRALVGEGRSSYFLIMRPMSRSNALFVASQREWIYRESNYFSFQLFVLTLNVLLYFWYPSSCLFMSLLCFSVVNKCRQFLWKVIIFSCALLRDTYSATRLRIT